MAFIAVREATDETVGVARLVREGGPGEAEFAVVVQQDAKGRGIATRLLQRIMEWGRAQGLTEIFGQILADNHPMLSFVRRSGFSIRHLPHDADVVEARLSLV
jgi:acetyltransferase